MNAVKQYNGDYRVRDFDCYNQCLHLLYGQLSVCTSLRYICLLLGVHKKSLYHLGIKCTVDASSLSRANESRDYRIYETLGTWLINKVRPMYSKESVLGVYLPGWEVLAIDSTTISCSIKLASWALGKYSKGGVNMHTVLDLRGSIPDQIYITDSRWHDSNFLDVISSNPFAIYAMDKAYVDFEALFRLHTSGCFFVTRAKETMRYEIEEKSYNIDEAVGIIADDIVRLTGYKSSKLYPQNIKMIKCLDPVSGETITFITNNMELGPLVIANIYRNRWQIETFFKWIKQNLIVKSLWGYSENAVKTHLWVAISAYLLLAWIKAALKSPYTVTEVATIIAGSLMSKVSLRELLVPELITKNQNDKEPLLF